MPHATAMFVAVMMYMMQMVFGCSHC